MGVNIFGQTIEKSNRWIKELMDILGWESEDKTYIALRSTLQRLRDRLTVEETADLSSQLPMLLRGMFFEGWIPGKQPVKYERQEYLEAVGSEFKDEPDMNIEGVVRGVFTLLSGKISDGEIEDIRAILPGDMKDLLT